MNILKVTDCTSCPFLFFDFDASSVNDYYCTLINVSLIREGLTNLTIINNVEILPRPTSCPLNLSDVVVTSHRHNPLMNLK